MGVKESRERFFQMRKEVASVLRRKHRGEVSEAEAKQQIQRVVAGSHKPREVKKKYRVPERVRTIVKKSLGEEKGEQAIRKIESSMIKEGKPVSVETIVTPERKEKKVLSKQEFQQELYSQAEQASRYSFEAAAAAEALKSMRFQPFQKYRVTTAEGKEVVVPGVVASLVSRREAKRLEMESMRISEVNSEIWSEIVKTYNWPSETKVVKTDKGYQVKFPDTRLDWSKQEFRKIEKAYKINPLLGATAELGFGITSSFAALGKPAADVVASAAGVKTKPVHYVSPWDYVFEPIGWAPKGSTELLSRHPVFTAGGVVGEVAQTIAVSKVLGVAGKGVSAGVKAGVKRTPRVLSTLESRFPSVFGKTFTESGKIVGGRVARFTHKVTETGFAKNVYGWAAKGWKPGKAMVEVVVKEPVKRSGLTMQKFAYRVDKSIPFWERRVWMTAKEYASFQSKLSSSGVVRIGFPTARATAGVGEVSFVAEGNVFRRGLFGGIRGRTYLFSRGVKTVGKQAGKLYDDTFRQGFGSFYRRGVVQPVVDVGFKENRWAKAYLEMLEKGYATKSPIKILQSGEIIEKGLSDVLKKTSYGSFYRRSVTQPITKLEGWGKAVNFVGGIGKKTYLSPEFSYFLKESGKRSIVRDVYAGSFLIGVTERRVIPKIGFKGSSRFMFQSSVREVVPSMFNAGRVFTPTLYIASHAASVYSSYIHDMDVSSFSPLIRFKPRFSTLSYKKKISRMTVVPVSVENYGLSIGSTSINSTISEDIQTSMVGKTTGLGVLQTSFLAHDFFKLGRQYSSYRSWEYRKMKSTGTLFPPFLFDLPSGGGSGYPIYEWGKKVGVGYRYRKWNVLRMEDILPREIRKTVGG